MKLLLDQNLSHRIVPALQEVYPDSVQVLNFGLNISESLLSRNGDQFISTYAGDVTQHAMGKLGIRGFPAYLGGVITSEALLQALEE